MMPEPLPPLFCCRPTSRIGPTAGTGPLECGYAKDLIIACVSDSCQRPVADSKQGINIGKNQDKTEDDPQAWRDSSIQYFTDP